ncbi:hypothetical protein QCA50_005076 [Cerrena zonata]|uniref:BRCT domain-containing protein n=1 Tax=Cerrena zonata TaxID=2478898 RepID=A0AAW0GP49_9APHY
MLPPPVPKGSKPAAGGNTGDTAQSTKRINLSSGIVVGKPKGKLGTLGSTSRQTATKPQPQASTSKSGTATFALAKPQIFGVGSFAVNHRPGGRVVHKVSKPSSLPVVEGSPVKGGSNHLEEIDAMDEDPKEANTSQSKLRGPFDFSDIAGDDKMDIDIPLTLDDLRADGTTTPTNDPDGSFSSANGSDSSAKGKEKASSWMHGASRRASMASQLLSQSLSSLPKTPPRSAGSDGRGKTRAASSNFPAGSAGAKTAPGALGKAGGSGAHVAAHGRTSEGSGSSQANGTAANGTNGPTAGSLKVLKGCKIFVDVRTDDGDDAGSLFVDMLEGLGAKLLGRVGSTCTHIVYKNGLMSTVTKYRLHEDPKPLVVGIAWVVECVEKRARVDETKFLINLDLVNVAGTTKRRKSMLPKHLMKSPVPPAVKSPAFQEGNSRTEDRSSSPGPEDSPAAANTSSGSLDDLTPLERARRRKSTLLNHGITRN